MLVDQTLVQANTFLVAARKIGPKTNLVQRLFVRRFALKYQFQTIEDFFKFFVVVIYISEFKQEVDAVVSLKEQKSLLEQAGSVGMHIKSEVGIRFQNIDVYIAGIKEFRLLQNCQGVTVTMGCNEQVRLLDQQLSGIREIF